MMIALTRTDLIFAASVIVASVGIVGLVTIVCRLLEPMPTSEPEPHEDRYALRPRHLAQPSRHVRIVTPPYDWAEDPSLDFPNHYKELHT